MSCARSGANTLNRPQPCNRGRGEWMLFSKNFDNIDFTDIETLVREKEREGWVLDYKQQFPSNEKIAALVSAFANTYGGYIVVGVEEESDGSNRPKGLKTVSDGGLTDRLDSICHTIIEPPVFCQSKYLDSSDGSVRVFLIKVPESDMTPHTVDRGTTVYVKVNAQKKPLSKDAFEKADLGLIEWLKNRRERHSEFRVNMDERALARSRETFAAQPPRSAISSELPTVPQYPRTPLLSYPELLPFLRSFQSSFGGLNVRTAIHVHDGVCVERHRSSGAGHYSEFNCYGLYYNNALIETEPGLSRLREVPDYVPLDRIVDNLTGSLCIGLELLERLGFVGSVMAMYSVRGIRGLGMNCGFPGQTEFYSVEGLRCEKEDTLSKDFIFTMSGYHKEIETFVIDFVSRLLYAFGNTDTNLAEKVFRAFLYSKGSKSLTGKRKYA